MAAVLLTGHGGLERLEYRTDVPVPHPKTGEVLIQVAAAGVNNTDVNTRIGWYSKAVAAETSAGGVAGFDAVDNVDAAWSGTALKFPRIQGADVCGRIVDVGEEVSHDRIGERVVVRTMMRTPVGYRPFECWTFGSECDGGFAQFTVAPALETYAVRSDWSDEELAAVPCAYSTAENMLHRTAVTAERVLVTGASGGVGLAAVQLARRRGAMVIAICSATKAADVRAQGADHTVDRGADLLSTRNCWACCAEVAGTRFRAPSEGQSRRSICERCTSRTCHFSDVRFKRTKCSRISLGISNAAKCGLLSLARTDIARSLARRKISSERNTSGSWYSSRPA